MVERHPSFLVRGSGTRVALARWQGPDVGSTHDRGSGPGDVPRTQRSGHRQGRPGPGSGVRLRPASRGAQWRCSPRKVRHERSPRTRDRTDWVAPHRRGRGAPSVPGLRAGVPHPLDRSATGRAAHINLYDRGEMPVKGVSVRFLRATRWEATPACVMTDLRGLVDLAAVRRSAHTPRHAAAAWPGLFRIH